MFARRTSEKEQKNSRHRKDAGSFFAIDQSITVV